MAVGENGAVDSVIDNRDYDYDYYSNLCFYRLRKGTIMPEETIFLLPLALMVWGFIYVVRNSKSQTTKQSQNDLSSK
jgi:hypothetical protein